MTSCVNFKFAVLPFSNKQYTQVILPLSYFYIPSLDIFVRCKSETNMTRYVVAWGYLKNPFNLPWYTFF